MFADIGEGDEKIKMELTQSQKDETLKSIYQVVDRIKPKLCKNEVLTFKEWREFYLAYDLLVHLNKDTKTEINTSNKNSYKDTVNELKKLGFTNSQIKAAMKGDND